MPKLDGKIAVITGGNSGIGLATAKVFVKEGARIYITGRRQPELEAAAALLGPRATPVHGDVSKPADLDRLYDRFAPRQDESTSFSQMPEPTPWRRSAT